MHLLASFPLILFAVFGKIFKNNHNPAHNAILGAAVLLGSIFVSLGIYIFVFRFVLRRKVSFEHHGTLRRFSKPAFWLFLIAATMSAFPAFRFNAGIQSATEHALHICLLLCVGWLLVASVYAVEDLLVRRYDMSAADNLAARRDLMEFYVQAPWILGGSKYKAWAQVEAIASRNALQGNLARAIYWRDLNRPTLAAREFRKVLESKPQQAAPYFQVADFYEDLRKPAEMEAAIRDVSLIVPNDPRVDYYSAVADVMKGQELAKAESDLKKYLAKTPPRNDFPPHASAHDWLGRIYEIKGNKEQAIKQYQSALSLSPDNRVAQQGLKRLDAN